MKIVLCNHPAEGARALAERVVRAGLAACVNLLGPVRSVYVWEGQVCDEPELTLLIKVAQAKVEALRDFLVAAHPYSCPEVLVLPVDVPLSHGPYVAWVRGAQPVTSKTEAP